MLELSDLGGQVYHQFLLNPLPLQFFFYYTPFVRQIPPRQIRARNPTGPDKPGHEEHKGPLHGAKLAFGRGCNAGIRYTRNLRPAGA